MKNPFDGQLKVVDGTEVNMPPTVPVVLDDVKRGVAKRISTRLERS
jgi:hypothetical protein